MKWFALFFILFHLSCVPQEGDPLISSSKSFALVQASDLVVTNYSGDAALLLDKDGNFKKLLYNVDNNKEQVVGVNWNSFNNRIVLSINGVPDRVISINPFDGEYTEVVKDSQYNGNTFGLAVDNQGSYLLIESHRLEKYSKKGIRINDANFPTGNLVNNLSQVSINKEGNIIVCGYGGDRVKVYDDEINQLASTASGIGGTTNAYGCKGNKSGQIVASWDGSSDAVVIYNSDLTIEEFRFQDTTLLTAPRGVEIKKNGNILVADATYHYLLELTPELEYVRTIGGGILNYPWGILEIPDYD